jgi:hypothetical protein
VSLANLAMDAAMRASAGSLAAVRGAGALLCEACATALLPRIRPPTASGWDAPTAAVLCNSSSPAGVRANGSGACELVSGAWGCVLGGFSLSLLVAASAPVGAATAMATPYGSAIPGALLDSAALSVAALVAVPLSGLAPGPLARFAAGLLDVSQVTAATSATLPPIAPAGPAAVPEGQRGRPGGLTNGGIAAICGGAIGALLLAVAFLSWRHRRASARMPGGASRNQ